MCTHMPCVLGVIEYKTAYIMQVGLSISHQFDPVVSCLVEGQGVLAIWLVQRYWCRDIA